MKTKRIDESRILSEGVVAFGASEKLRRSFISASGLHLPNIDYHVPAFGALHPHRGHSVHVVFYAYDSDLLLQGMLYDFARCFCFNFLFSVRLHVTAF